MSRRAVSSSARASTLAIALAATAGACSSAPGSDSGDEPVAGGTFLAFPSHFQGYKTWEKFVVAAPTTNDAHTSGPRTEYLNRRPAKQASEFPVATIIVKELEVGTEGERKVFAMVKRGGTYNKEGARGWEWFELENGSAGAVSIVWRGLGPPVGEMYGGDANGGCNVCHSASRNNDFVSSSGLSLTNL